MPRLDNGAQGLARRDQMLLADDIVQGIRTHPVGRGAAIPIYILSHAGDPPPAGSFPDKLQRTAGRSGPRSPIHGRRPIPHHIRDMEKIELPAQPPVVLVKVIRQPAGEIEGRQLLRPVFTARVVSIKISSSGAGSPPLIAWISPGVIGESSAFIRARISTAPEKQPAAAYRSGRRR